MAGKTISFKVPFEAARETAARVVDLAFARKVTVKLVFTGKIAPGYAVIRPLSAALVQDPDGSYVLSDLVVFGYGRGRTLEAAQSAYVESLIKMYELHSGHDDDQTQAVFRRLRQYLRPSQ